MFASTPEQIDAVKASTDAFLTLSKIAFSSIERLSALNLSVARAALEESVATSTAMFAIKDPKEAYSLRSPVPGKALETAATYLRDAQAITVDTQKQVTTLMTSIIPSLVGNSNADTSWNQGFNVMNQFAKQITAMTVANSKPVDDATTQIATPVIAHARKAA
jgi:phasin family protein